ncbi:hypothetical protein [Cytobacillus depressus]|nr:hypothetical protein [Cytobacillus depressus]
MESIEMVELNEENFDDKVMGKFMQHVVPLTECLGAQSFYYKNDNIVLYQ